VRRDVLAALLEYVSTHGATVLMSSHLVHEQERVCDWIGVMDAGRLVAEMPMHAFRSGIKRLRIAGAPALAKRRTGIPAMPPRLRGCNSETIRRSEA
jgi:ABC-2 type transport system ATP-binding protein